MIVHDRSLGDSTKSAEDPPRREHEAPAVFVQGQLIQQLPRKKALTLNSENLSKRDKDFLEEFDRKIL